MCRRPAADLFLRALPAAPLLTAKAGASCQPAHSRNESATKAYRGQNYAALADGSEVVFDFYALTVLWDGQPRHVDTDALGDVRPLVGMALLDSHSLYAEVEDGGRVVIEPR